MYPEFLDTRHQSHRNYIKGRPATFGDWEQIREVIRYDRIMKGEINFMDEIEWHFASYSYTRDFYYYTDWKEADSLICFVKCPRCRSKNRYAHAYDFFLHYDYLVAANEAMDEFECCKCGLEFEHFDGLGVYVKEESTDLL